uniref:sorting nexin-3 isoform X2 n=1 Tax=Scatophagus argus TaxID=75038 RepID=UPI001ED7D377|nr:sorting nexin-3 isoform X2 [Scatophagus argus]
MLEHWGDKAKIIHFSCDLRKRRSEGLIDNFTWRELEISGNEKFSELTNLPIFKLKESCVRRRYSDFEWLRAELERESKVVVPPLPGKALFRQLPFRGDDGIFDDSFIEERRQGLEQFLNKVAGHPLAQNERCLHMFLQEESVDKSYTPSKIRQA